MLRWTLLVGLLMACGTDDKDDTGTTWVEETGTTTTDTTPSGSGGSGGSGLSEPTLLYAGSALIDTDAATWTGTETATYTDNASGLSVCEWQWTALDWDQDPNTTGTPAPDYGACIDGDGNACAFQFAVNLSSGATSAGDCGPFSQGVDGGTYGYGYIIDYQNNGSSYGEQLMYSVPNGAAASWIPAPHLGIGSVTLDPMAGQIDYELSKILITTYVP